MKKGGALILVILLTGLFLALGAISVRMVYNCYASVNAEWLKEQAFWLAASGLEKGKMELAHDPNWSTDQPYYLNDNVLWLVGYAVGQESTLGDGSFKVVRESGKNSLYAIGRKGRGTAILKVRFSAPPLRVLEWQEL
jgi:hypothetical protein